MWRHKWAQDSELGRIVTACALASGELWEIVARGRAAKNYGIQICSQL
jgi:hypothetical protein